jgi:hypothetical protein
MSLSPEARAREAIDSAIVAAGWIIQGRAETNVAGGLGDAVREILVASKDLGTFMFYAFAPPAAARGGEAVDRRP